MNAVITDSKTQEFQKPKFELTDLRIPFVDMGGRVYKPQTVIVAFKTHQIMMDFYISVKPLFSDLVVFDRRDNEPKSIGMRLRMEHIQTKTVSDILKALKLIVGEEEVNGFLKKYSD